ncbi:11472_t:CDS:2, partial [Entrophospora sp. SA101]
LDESSIFRYQNNPLGILGKSNRPLTDDKYQVEYLYNLNKLGKAPSEVKALDKTFAERTITEFYVAQPMRSYYSNRDNSAMAPYNSQDRLVTKYPELTLPSSSMWIKVISALGAAFVMVSFVMVKIDIMQKPNSNTGLALNEVNTTVDADAGHHIIHIQNPDISQYSAEKKAICQSPSIYGVFRTLRFFIVVVLVLLNLASQFGWSIGLPNGLDIKVLSDAAILCYVNDINITPTTSTPELPAITSYPEALKLSAYDLFFLMIITYSSAIGIIFEIKNKIIDATYVTSTKKTIVSSVSSPRQYNSGRTTSSVSTGVKAREITLSSYYQYNTGQTTSSTNTGVKYKTGQTTSSVNAGARNTSWKANTAGFNKKNQLIVDIVKCLVKNDKYIVYGNWLCQEVISDDEIYQQSCENIWQEKYTQESLKQFLKMTSAGETPIVEVICHLVWKEKHRVFGYWKCLNCRKKWVSAYTWLSLQKFIDKTPGNKLLEGDFCVQECKKCKGNENKNVMIWKYEPLILSETGKPHKRDLCAKCQDGEYCTRTGTYYGHRQKNDYE